MDELCTISLEPLSIGFDGRQIRITPCVHKFHHTCIRPLLVRQQMNSFVFSFVTEFFFKNRWMFSTKFPSLQQLRKFCPNCKKPLTFRSTTSQSDSNDAQHVGQENVERQGIDDLQNGNNSNNNDNNGNGEHNLEEAPAARNGC